MFKFLYIALIISLIAGIAFAGWKFRGKKNSHKIEKDNKTCEATLNESGTYEKKQIVFFGDSEISLWPMQSNFGILPLMNRGYSGDFATECMERFKNEVISLNPDAIVLLIGTNDINDGVSPSKILQSIHNLIKEGKRTKAKIVVCGLLPVSSEVANAGRPVSSILEINNSLSEICHEEGLDYVDFYNALLNEDGFFDKTFSDDGLHPNNKGYLVMSGIILPYILRILQ
jgi:lysophospholipase L1-like esterase